MASNFLHTNPIIQYVCKFYNIIHTSVETHAQNKMGVKQEITNMVIIPVHAKIVVCVGVLGFVCIFSIRELFVLKNFSKSEEYIFADQRTQTFVWNFLFFRNPIFIISKFLFGMCILQETYNIVATCVIPACFVLQGRVGSHCAILQSKIHFSDCAW